LDKLLKGVNEKDAMPDPVHARAVFNGVILLLLLLLCGGGLSHYLTNKNLLNTKAPADSGKLQYDSKFLKRQDGKGEAIEFTPKRRPLTPAPPTNNNRFHMGAKHHVVRHRLDKFAV
jgi:hypothetical protein